MKRDGSSCARQRVPWSLGALSRCSTVRQRRIDFLDIDETLRWGLTLVRPTLDFTDSLSEDHLLIIHPLQLCISFFLVPLLVFRRDQVDPDIPYIEVGRPIGRRELDKLILARELTLEARTELVDLLTWSRGLLESGRSRFELDCEMLIGIGVFSSNMSSNG